MAMRGGPDPHCGGTAAIPLEQYERSQHVWRSAERSYDYSHGRPFAQTVGPSWDKRTLLGGFLFVSVTT